MFASGDVVIHMHFFDLWVESEDDADLIDAIFPDGWEGEMLGFTIDNVEFEEE